MPEIFKAIYTIKMTCLHAEWCENCPLFIQNMCLLEKQSPEFFDLNMLAEKLNRGK